MVKIHRRSIAPTKGKSGYTATYVADVLLRSEITTAGFIIVNIPAKTKTIPHAHMELEEIFIVMNPTKLGINGEIHQLEKGDLVVVNPGEAHHFETYNEPVTVIAIKLPNLKDDKVQAE